MIKALTIRFGLMCLLAPPLVAGLKWIDPAPQLGMIALMTYVLSVVLVIGRYCLAHQDEIPSRPPQDAPPRESHRA
jgi:hypothetical protein